MKINTFQSEQRNENNKDKIHNDFLDIYCLNTSLKKLRTLPSHIVAMLWEHWICLHCSQRLQYKICVQFVYIASWAQNLRQGIVMKTSFESRRARMGLGSFVDINIFVMKYYFIYFIHILHFFESFKSKSTLMLRPQKTNECRWMKLSSFHFGVLTFK